MYHWLRHWRFEVNEHTAMVLAVIKTGNNFCDFLFPSIHDKVTTDMRSTLYGKNLLQKVLVLFLNS